MLVIRQLKVKVFGDIKTSIAKKLKTKESNIFNYSIRKRSIDARKGAFYVYECAVSLKNENEILKKNTSKDIFKLENETYTFTPKGNKKMKSNPIICGSGPAGLFCAYLLCEYGYKPIIIERGDDVDKRTKKVDLFWETGKLDINSNVQFGEGGAGTFSDGKLNTLVKDKHFRMKKVFETFVKFGAPEEILYDNKPHIGTDILKEVVKNMRNHIIKKGGKIKYNSTLKDIFITNNKITSVLVNNEIIPCDTLILAIGNSARDTFKMLKNKNINMTNKPFAIGIRVMHPQKLINENQYKNMAQFFCPASYKLTYNEARSVYSFCMCPGGYVVNASSEEGMLAINGMSYHDRKGENANSAIVVGITPKDYGNDILDGIKFQETLEKKAYESTDGKIPVQLYGDFVKNKISTSFKKVKPTFKGDYQFANLNDILPNYICENIIKAMNHFNTKIKGFNSDDVIIAGVETRTSSPVRINRDESYMCNISGIFPAGEGAGYAGGITSAAMDGIRVAEAIMNIYSNQNNFTSESVHEIPK